MRTTFWSGLIGLVCVLVVTDAPRAAAQSFQGGLRGAVKDADGVIQGADVTLINEDTTVARPTRTNEVGEYAFSSVNPGTYTLRVVQQGFKTFERRGIVIGTQQFLTLDVTMEVGAIQEEVTSTGELSTIETSNASTGEVLDKAALANQPSAARNAFMNAVSVQTVIASGDAQFNRMQDQSNASLISMGGGARRANNYLIDGVPITDLTNRPSLFATMESVAEVKVQVHTYDAEMGRTGGGAFNTTARSGSNEFHGSGYFQQRPDWGAANNFFNKRAGIPKPEGLYYVDYGGSSGGPIIRNKTFFWAAAEGYKSITTRNGQLIFPTDRERAGDFSQTFDRNGQLVVIYDPLTTRTVNGVTIRDPFPGNVIPADRINPVARNLVGLFPRPDVDTSGANGVANYLRTAQLHDDAKMVTTKVEHKLSDSWSLTGLYIISQTHEPSPTYWEATNPFADPGSGRLTRTPQVLALNTIMIPTPSTVLSLRFGLTDFPDKSAPISLGYDLTSLGFPAAFANSVTAQKFPAVNIRSGSALDIGEIGGASSMGDRGIGGSIWKSWGINGSLSKFVGRHTFKFGADFREIRTVGEELGQSAGTFIFDREWTQQNPLAGTASNNGSSLASFLLGLPSANSANVSSVPINVPLEFFVRYYGGYAQDDFRLTSKLTLNYGLRYEYETGMKEQENRFTVAFDRDAVSPLAELTGLDIRGGLRYAGLEGFPDYQTNPSKTKFSPRGGFAWSLNDRTVLRGGYGMFWAPWNYTAASTANYGQIGFSQTTFVDQSNRLTPTVTLDNPFPGGLIQPVGNSQGLLTGAGQQIQYIPQERKSPYVQQFSVDFQRELPGSMTASIGYSGARGDQVGYGGSGVGLVNINQLTPEQVAQWGPALNDRLPNPFFGIAGAGPLSTQATLTRAQLIRPFPQFLNILARDPGGARSRYHAVILKLEKRRSHGWGGRFNYTWSRLSDNQFGETNFFSTQNQGSLPLNSYDLDAEYGRGILDTPHRIVLSPTFELPFGQGRKWATGGWGDRLAGGWLVSMIATYETGFPINIVQQDNTNSFGGVQRPNWTGTDPTTDGPLYDDDSFIRLNNYINSAAYALAAPFTFGTAPRLDARNRTPFRTNYDVVFSKDTRILGSIMAQVRLEILNITNTPKFRQPAATLGSASFGTITSQSGFSRLTQLLFRVSW
jgi:hypothetical protein